MKCTMCGAEFHSLEEAKKPCPKAPPTNRPEEIGHTLLFGDYLDLRKKEGALEYSMPRVGSDEWWAKEEPHGPHGIVHVIGQLLWQHDITPRKADELIQELFTKPRTKCPPACWDNLNWGYQEED